ncbi:MAG: hypothetical protein ACP5VS_16675 [Desulfomonilaceae bacterium]
MPSAEVSTQNANPKPYQSLKDDPKFELIRRMINNLPRDKMINLKKYISNLDKS